MIKSLARDKGTTVFLCTHQLRYAEEICTKYGLISEGSILASGSLDELHSLVFSGLKAVVKRNNDGERKSIFVFGRGICNNCRITLQEFIQQV